MSAIFTKPVSQPLSLPLVPESAPFNEAQRSWLNGFLAGWLGLDAVANNSGLAVADIPSVLLDSMPSPPATSDEASGEDVPWHNPELSIDERAALAQDRPLADKLMASMAQLDCGACGYLCRTYSQAIATGDEKNLTLCSPGGKPTVLALKKLLQAKPAAPSDSMTGEKQLATAARPVEPGMHRDNPCPVKLKQKYKLNGLGSSKITTHVELDIHDTAIDYRVGDSLGVYPTNCPQLVAQVIAELKADMDESITLRSGASLALANALLSLDLRYVSDDLLNLLHARTTDTVQQTALTQMMNEGTDLDVLEVLQLVTGADVSPIEVCQALSSLQPRLYSISSSPQAHRGEVHLTVARVETESNNRTRKGVASTMFSDRLMPGDQVSVYLHRSHDFTIPSEPHAPMIMVGPGTGIAPFRAFLQERAALGARGPNWLFFGDQHAATDFLYREELHQLLKLGFLTRLDTAFSRDQAKKIYVQDRIRQQGDELYRWLENGAYFYVCGDARRMATDVDRALRDVIRTHGNLDESGVTAYVENLKATSRYVRDVY